MATAKQTAANRENAQHSTGPTSQARLDASARINAWRHGLAVKDHERFGILYDENPDKFNELLARLTQEHAPTTETEVILMRHMAQSEWLRARALRLQADCVQDGLAKEDVAKLGVLIRYQTTHERAFHRSLKELQNLRKERRNVEIGFGFWNSIRINKLRMPKNAFVIGSHVIREIYFAAGTLYCQ